MFFIVHCCFSQGKVWTWWRWWSAKNMSCHLRGNYVFTNATIFHQRNFRKLQWVSGTLTCWNMVCISPITPTCSSLNLSSTLINWFVRSGPGRSSLFKHVQCYIKMLKWFVRSCVTLLDKMFFADLGVGKMFYSSTMLEFDHDDGICF